MLSTIAFNVDYLVLTARLSPAAVGYYWRGYMLGVTYPSKISNIMLSIALPLYSRAPDHDEMRRLRLRVMATHAAAVSGARQHHRHRARARPLALGSGLGTVGRTHATARGSRNERCAHHRRPLRSSWRSGNRSTYRRSWSP